MSIHVYITLTDDIQILICCQNERPKISDFPFLSICKNYWVNDHLAWLFYLATLPETAYKVDVRENITKDNLSQHLFI